MGGVRDEVRGKTKIETYLNYVRHIEGVRRQLQFALPGCKKQEGVQNYDDAGSRNRGMDSALPFPHIVGWW
jgi:hypothetical protein